MNDTEYRRRNRVRDALIYWAYCTVPKCTYRMLSEVTGLSMVPIARIIRAQRNGTHPWVSTTAMRPVQSLANAQRAAKVAAQADRERRQLAKWRAAFHRGLRAYALRINGMTGREIGQRVGGVCASRGLALAERGWRWMVTYYMPGDTHGRWLLRRCGNHQRPRKMPASLVQSWERYLNGDSRDRWK